MSKRDDVSGTSSPQLNPYEDFSVFSVGIHPPMMESKVKNGKMTQTKGITNR
eukprot:CAMPEP_0117432880 /NCGR_PEP_ID=MMETSP0758-20121206/12303_1 /TAXON_ID=63605 /ORGANISM="Percolomonas cosmopolitus, Strain AE-1 (ATCC 50343)" /LENGTH=51 /DNA_ID=CAMNT_0005223109 /DNA_START=59 /DNA_END=211 /DNA_ORIENTATION=+